MIINAATCNKVSKLLSPKVSQVVKGGEKLFGEHGLSVFTPNNATACDVIHGIGKRGEFQSFLFKNDEGKAIQHYTRYFKNNNHYTDVITDIENNTNNGTGLFNLTRKTVSGLRGNSYVEKIEHNSMMCFPLNNKKMAQKSYMTLTPNGDFGGMEILQSGKSPVGFKFNYNWDGKPTNIEYNNTLGKKLDITETEAQYLPFVNRRLVIVEQNGQYAIGSEDFTTDRVAEKIGLAQIIQERLHGIKEGLLPRAKEIKQDDLVAVKMTKKTTKELEKEGKFIPFAEALPNGQIHVATNVPNGTDGRYILDRVAHEMQHESDFIKMNCGGTQAYEEALSNIGKTREQVIKDMSNEELSCDYAEFQKKCIEKNGLFKKGSPKYEEAVRLNEVNLGATNVRNIKDNILHDVMDFERRAIKTEGEQMGILEQVSQKIGNFMNQLIC